MWLIRWLVRLAPATFRDRYGPAVAVVALAGIVAGLAIALTSSRLIESVLYGVGARDPGVFAATTLILAAVSLVACWLPARRASRLSPIDALRD